MPVRAQRSARVLSCLLAALALFFSPSAMARLAVPMCGENAESIEAPPSMRAASDASLDPAPCGSTDEAIQRGVPGDRPVERVVPEGPPRMLPLVHPLPASPKYERVERRDVLDQARPGFVESLYRPPR